MISDKYHDRPLLGRVTAVKQDVVTIDWMVGSYSGVWREWRGRSEGKSVIYSDNIKVTDILLPNITFTKCQKLKQDTTMLLKELYSKY